MTNYYLTQLATDPRYLENQLKINGLITEFLRFSENQNSSIFGSITEIDEKGIAAAVRLASKYSGPVVELGTLFGHTTVLLADLLAGEKKLITIDDFSWNPFCLPKDIHRQFTTRTLRYFLARNQIELYEGSAKHFYAAHPDLQPSLVFVDASHEYKDVCDDLDWCIARKCPVICGHDYCAEHREVIDAVSERFGEHVTVFGSVWIAKPNYMGRVATQ